MKWIPVSERLPDVNAPVLGCAIYTTGEYQYVLPCYIDRLGAWRTDFDFKTIFIEYWMPLPEPPTNTPE